VIHSSLTECELPPKAGFLLHQVAPKTLLYKYMCITQQIISYQMDAVHWFTCWQLLILLQTC